MNTGGLPYSKLILRATTTNKKKILARKCKDLFYVKLTVSLSPFLRKTLRKPHKDLWGIYS